MGITMKITQGFVAVKKDGSFLHISERTTHTGSHIDVCTVAYIEDASVFSAPRFYSRSMLNAVTDDFNWVPVEVRREVVLTGYGVKS